MLEDNTQERKIQELIKPCPYNLIGPYGNDDANGNVFIGEDSQKKRCLMIRVPYNKLSLSLIENINNCTQLNCSALIGFISISKLNDDYYLVYDYCYCIQLGYYITKATPNGRKRLMLLNEFANVMELLNKNHMPLYEFPIDFVFVESFDSCTIRLLYSHGLIVNGKAKTEGSEALGIGLYNQQDYFNWLSNFIYAISKFNMKSDNEDFNAFFNEFGNEVSVKLKMLFERVFTRYKEGNGNNYSFESFCSELKAIYDEFDSKGNSNKSKKVFEEIKEAVSGLDKKAPSSGAMFNIKDVKTKEMNHLKGNLFECDSSSKAKAKPQPNKANQKNTIKGENAIVKNCKEEEQPHPKASVEVNNNISYNNTNKPFNSATDTSLLHNSSNGKMNGYLPLFPLSNQSNPNTPQSFISPLNNYSLWLNQTLNRVNSLDQILLTQLIDINQLWANIQLSHYHFINQMPIPSTSPNNPPSK